MPPLIPSPVQPAPSRRWVLALAAVAACAAGLLAQYAGVSGAAPFALVHAASAASVAPAVAASPVAAAAPASWPPHLPTGPNSVGAFGSARHRGEIGDFSRSPVVGVAPTPRGNGYWLVAADGGVFSFGDAPYFGSAAPPAHAAAIVGVAATRTGRGYWLVAADGGVFAFGDAPFLGSAAGRSLSGPVVGIAATPTARGYWLAAADGGVFAFGDASYRGRPFFLAQPVSAITATPTGKGYWLLGRNGAVVSLGDASAPGDLVGRAPAATAVGLATTPSGKGYWIATADGGVFAFGDAPFKGSAASAPPAPIVGFQASPDGRGYWMVTGRPVPLLHDLGSFSLTCYALPGHTASGLPVGEEVIAVDPRVIPLFAHLFIPGLAPLAGRVAADTGTAIIGHRIDVWMSSYAACLRFGRADMEVYLVG